MALTSEAFISVLIPVHNGEATIGRALDSMLAQDYPRDQYEVIVVNDGSTDNTAQAVAGRPAAHYVELPANVGKSAALNAGLAVAHGEICVTFDDDCQAAPDYLSNLALAYREMEDPLGVGGVIIDDRSGDVRGVVARYVEAISTGNQRIESGVPTFASAILSRFLTYLVTNYTDHGDRHPGDYSKVAELYGCNSSFPTVKLRQIGGWDVEMSAPAVGGIEDRDICFRLRQRFPGYHFYTARRAYLKLDQDPGDKAVSARTYLLRPYRRGTFNYSFHVKNGLTPPVFPFPVLIALAILGVAAATAASAVSPVLLPLLIVALPQLCYGWWIKRAVLRRQPVYLLFAYIQVAEESMTLAGLVKGYLAFRMRARADEPRQADSMNQVPVAGSTRR